MITNLFGNIPNKLNEELFEEILNGKEFRIERIVSQGHKSEKNFWYDQEDNEIVFLLKGSAEISLENEKSELHPGDYLIIPAHRKHRVEKTDASGNTVWLAIYYK